MEEGIDTLRAMVAWANDQDEAWWYPTDRVPPTLIDIRKAFEACKEHDVERIDHLTDEQAPAWVLIVRVDPEPDIIEKAKQKTTERLEGLYRTYKGKADGFIALNKRLRVVEWVEYAAALSVVLRSRYNEG